MLTIISPSKTLDFETNRELSIQSEPGLLEDSEKIMKVLQKKSAEKLMELQSISKNLAELNFERNQMWNSTHDSNQTRSALTAFKGDVYVGLDANNFSDLEDQFANDHLRILSGLYGILKPSDQIMPYRLEMGTKLKTTRGKDIYSFWKSRITEIVNQELAEQSNPALINLASDEYYNVLDPKAIKHKIIQPVFMDKKNGKYKVISFYAKKARGLMSRFMIKNQIDAPELLQGFDAEGYLHKPDMSTTDKWVFARDQE